MKPTGRRLAFAAPVVLCVFLSAACTGGPSAGTETPSPGTRGSAESPLPTISAPPGTTVYLYRNAGLTATMLLRSSGGTLSIQNQTGHDVASPGFYLLGASDGRRVEGEVQAAAPTAEGQTSEFHVSFAGLSVKDIGLIVLTIGGVNDGGFVRQ